MALHISDDGVLTKNGKAHNPRRLHVDVTPMLCQSITPESRCGAASFVHAGRLYVFGGGGGALGKHVSDGLFSIGVHHTSTDESGWTRVRCRCAVEKGPRARSECSTAVVPGSDMMYLFGGLGGPDSMSNALSSQRRDTFDDAWSLNLKTFTWFRMPTHPGRNAGGCLPSGRRGHTAVAIPEGIMIIFGGTGLERSFSCETYFNDAWGLEVKSGAWCKAPQARQPSPRSFHTATLLDDETTEAKTNDKIDKEYRMVVIGGTGASFQPTASGPQIQMASVGTSVFAPDQIYVLTISVTQRDESNNNNNNNNTVRTTAQAKRKKTSNIGLGNTGATTQICTEFSWSSPADVQGESCGSRYGHTAVSVKRGKVNNVLVFGGFPKENNRSQLSVYCLTVPPPVAAVAPNTNTTNTASRHEDRRPWCWSTAVMTGGVVLQGPRFMHAAQSVSDKKMVVYGGCKLEASDPGFCRGDVCAFNISYKRESSTLKRAAPKQAKGNVGANARLDGLSMLNSLGSVASTDWQREKFPRDFNDPAPSTRRLVHLERSASSTHLVIRGLRKFHANPSRQVQPLKQAKLSSTQRASRISGLPVNPQGIEAALRRRNDILASTRSIINFRREKAQRDKIAKIVSFEKPRNLSTIGFNNRRIKIGLGKIRAPFCLKIGMYGGVPAEVAKAGLRQRPVSAPRKRRESRFTRSNVFTQSTRRLANEQSLRPQSAMPAMRSFGASSYSKTSSLPNTSGHLTRRGNNRMKQQRPQSAALRRKPSAMLLETGSETKKKNRPQSAHAGRRTPQRYDEI